MARVVVGIAALLALGCSPGLVTREVSGQVVDGATGAPVAEAFVVVHVYSRALLSEVYTQRDVMWVRTNTDGWFTFSGVVNRLFPFNLGWQTELKVIAPGYEPAGAAVGNVTGLAFGRAFAHVAMRKTVSTATPQRLQCDVLWPSYQARGTCEQLAYRMAKADP
jgi:hypothetical protein